MVTCSFLVLPFTAPHTCALCSLPSQSWLVTLIRKHKFGFFTQQQPFWPKPPAQAFLTSLGFELRGFCDSDVSGVFTGKTRRSGFPFDVLCVLSGIARCMEPSGLKKALSFRAVELSLRLEGTLGGWLRVLQFCHLGRQDGVEATSRNIATGTREEVMELVVDAPVLQVLLEPQVHVSLRLPFVEQVVDEPMLQERFVPVDVPQVIEQLTGVTMSSSQDRILQSTREQFLDVPVPRMVEQFGERCLRWCLKN